jgi:hypothetical protein
MDTSKYSSSSIKKLNLRNVDTSFICHYKFPLINSLNGFINTSGIYNIFRIWFVCNTCKLKVFN